MENRSFKSKLANYAGFLIVFFGFPLACWFVLVSVVKFLYRLFFG